MDIVAMFTQIPVGTWIVIGLFLAFGVALMCFTTKVKWNTKMLTYAAMCVACSVALSYFKFVQFAQDGSVTPASMLPIMIFAYAYGFGPGLVCSMAFAFLELFQPSVFILGWEQATLDYILAPASMALMALFRNWKSPFSLPVGAIAVGVARVFFHVLSGVIYFASYAPEGVNPLVYSLTYNLSTAGVDALVCVVVASIPAINKFARNMVVRN